MPKNTKAAAAAVLLTSLTCLIGEAAASPAAVMCETRQELAVAIEDADAIVVAEVLERTDRVTKLPDGSWSSGPYPRRKLDFVRTYRVVRSLKGEIGADTVVDGSGSCTSNPPGYPSCRAPKAPPEGETTVVFLTRDDGGHLHPFDPFPTRYGFQCPAPENTSRTLAQFPEIAKRVLGTKYAEPDAEPVVDVSDDEPPGPIEDETDGDLHTDDWRAPPAMPPGKLAPGPRGCACAAAPGAHRGPAGVGALAGLFALGAILHRRRRKGGATSSATRRCR